MKSLIYFTLSLVLLSSCGETIKGDGNLVTEERPMEAFTELKVSGMFTVVLIQGEPKVVIDTDQNLLEHISTAVDKNKLTLSSNNKMLQTDQLVLTVYYRSIEEVDLSGACDLETSGSINGESFALEVSGAAEADLTLNVTNFELELSGGGDIDLKGIANNVAIGISGAAEVNAFELESKKANISVSRAGEVEINASEELDVDISGAGEITYIGNPTIKKNISGVGELKQK
jgi:hypothetical protein